MADQSYNPGNPQGGQQMGGQSMGGQPMGGQQNGGQQPVGGQPIPPQQRPVNPQQPAPGYGMPQGVQPQQGQYSAPMGGQPYGAYHPPAGTMGGTGDAGMAGQFGGPTPPPQQPEDTTPANFQLGAKLPKVLDIPVPAHNLKFDEQYFLRLLAGSISLTKDEKKRIIESIPKLRQAQIDELIKIFEDEKKKFAELSKKYTEQLEKLAQKHFEDWMDLETSFKQQKKTVEDDKKAEEIRKKLGLA